MSDSEDELALSSNALAALQEFKQEEEERQNTFEKLYKQANQQFEKLKKEQGMELFKEDWQLSQFWYTEETANILADALLEGADPETVIAIVSAPSVYAAIQKRPKELIPTEHIFLFEYDTRFELLAGKEHYFFYDYVNPLGFSDKLKGKVNRILIDPPFLNYECQTHSSITAKALLSSHSNSLSENRFISCTGERMADLLSKLYPDAKVTTFIPQHANGLSNEFKCYSNFECDGWKFV
ncbi:BN860_08086g1_1 [Zygosaccharomyces bailii CLIB 213]|uniref:Protein-lysine N-methyltransferase EFM5 n=1 Tax=Zygosaccharomyces bailii (strain CLIB 213 / ATCC 58445 / CBS 680 / BCRC 21525 / NBRC 1098 / NCYC 1416 / NRRL Y-2227) TaxID=1333698 RepID=A0A8J2X558_ZYGB2|nr:BN860_08086g1_1 [Zygosaccharomyces bailii CLIB 213]